MSITYFAYGSCMSRESFRGTVPDFKVLGRAVLNGYKLAFTWYSKSRNGGVADIVSSPKDLVEGVLYDFLLNTLKNLILVKA